MVVFHVSSSPRPAAAFASVAPPPFHHHHSFGRLLSMTGQPRGRPPRKFFVRGRAAANAHAAVSTDIVPPSATDTLSLTLPDPLDGLSIPVQHALFACLAGESNGQLLATPTTTSPFFLDPIQRLPIHDWTLRATVPTHSCTRWFENEVQFLSLTF